MAENMAVTRSWKVYGAEGHRQRESFNESCVYDFTEGEDVRKIEVENSDKTGTNNYSIVRITRNTAEQCEEELESQISDGIFENSRVGEVVEISTVKDEAIQKAIDKVVNTMSEWIAGAADKDTFRAGLEAHTENMVLDFNDNGEFDIKFTKEELDDITGYAVGLLVDYFPQKFNVIYQGDEEEEFTDETATYEDLKAEILKQAAEAGIEAETLNFMYD